MSRFAYGIQYGSLHPWITRGDRAMSVTVFSKLPDGFLSWTQFLVSSYSTKNLCESKQREFSKLHEKKMEEFSASITPLSKNCIVISYPLSERIFKTNSDYGNYSFRFLNIDTGTRRQVPFSHQKLHGLNSQNGTCIFTTVWPFYSRQLEIEKIAAAGVQKWNDSIAYLHDQYREYIVPAKLPSARERYALYLRSKQWHEKALIVKQRDNYLCACCCSSKCLEVHHKTYERWGNERYDDLMTVCRACHARIHGLFPI